MKKLWIFIPLVLLFFSCISIEDMAMDSVADMLSGTGNSTAIMGDDDPVLIGDAMPLALKIYEIILESKPEHQELLFSTGRNYVLYAGGFVQLPASMLPDEDYREQVAAVERAERLFRRGRGYLARAAEVSHPGIMEMLADERVDEALAMITPEETDLFYWLALSWVGEFSCNPFNMELGLEMTQALAVMYRILELDDNYSNGELHGTLVQIHASMPPSIPVNTQGKSAATKAFMESYYAGHGVETTPEAMAIYHYERALELSGGNNPSLYITYANSFSVKSQDHEEYVEVLERALAIDPDAFPENRLQILLYQEKAAWMLEHIEDYFLL